MILYFTPTTCSLASDIALEEAGAAFETKLVKLWDAEAHGQYKASINPKGSVPALDVDGRLLTENVAILSYVARTHAAAGLLPDSEMDQAQALSLCAWFSSSVHISRRQYRAPQRFTPDASAHPALKEAGEGAFWSHLQRLDGLLEGRDWLCGDRLSIADAYAMVFYDWGTRDERPMATLTHFTRLKDRMMERTAVRRALERERSVLVAAPAAAT